MLLPRIEYGDVDDLPWPQVYFRAAGGSRTSKQGTEMRLGAWMTVFTAQELTSTKVVAALGDEEDSHHKSSSEE
jgi:hypothetical protein